MSDASAWTPVDEKVAAWTPVQESKMSAGGPVSRFLTRATGLPIEDIKANPGAFLNPFNKEFQWKAQHPDMTLPPVAVPGAQTLQDVSEGNFAGALGDITPGVVALAPLARPAFGATAEALQSPIIGKTVMRAGKWMGGAAGGTAGYKVAGAVGAAAGGAVGAGVGEGIGKLVAKPLSRAASAVGSAMEKFAARFGEGGPMPQSARVMQDIMDHHVAESAPPEQSSAFPPFQDVELASPKPPSLEFNVKPAGEPQASTVKPLSPEETADLKHSDKVLKDMKDFWAMNRAVEQMNKQTGTGQAEILEAMRKPGGAWRGKESAASSDPEAASAQVDYLKAARDRAGANDSPQQVAQKAAELKYQDSHMAELLKQSLETVKAAKSIKVQPDNPTGGIINQ